MSDFYEKTAVGTSPVLLAAMKTYMKVTATADDALIQILIDACTEYGEKYTARDFRANTYKLLTDCFVDRQRLLRNPIDTITTIKHLVSGSLVTVGAADYYKKDLTQRSEVLLINGKSWPTNTDDREHAIEYIFVTKAVTCINTAINAIYRHVSFMYENRGDCDCQDVVKAGAASGADMMYNTFRISRV